MGAAGAGRGRLEAGAEAVSEPERDETARTSAIAAAVLGACFTVGGLAVGGPKTGASIAVGAAIAVANLLTMRAIIGALLTPADEDDVPAPATEDRAEALASPADPVAEAEAEGAAEAERDPSGEGQAPGDASSKERGRRGGAAWGVFALLKILVLFGGIGLLLMRGWVEAIPLVIGYGVLPLGITASTVLASLRPKRRGRR